MLSSWLLIIGVYVAVMVAYFNDKERKRKKDEQDAIERRRQDEECIKETGMTLREYVEEYAYPGPEENITRDRYNKYTNRLIEEADDERLTINNSRNYTQSEKENKLRFIDERIKLLIKHSNISDNYSINLPYRATRDEFEKTINDYIARNKMEH